MDTDKQVLCLGFHHHSRGEGAIVEMVGNERETEVVELLGNKKEVARQTGSGQDVVTEEEKLGEMEEEEE